MARPAKPAAGHGAALVADRSLRVLVHDVVRPACVPVEGQLGAFEGPLGDLDDVAGEGLIG